MFQVNNSDSTKNDTTIDETSDEDQPLPKCNDATEHRCNDVTRRCIPRRYVMNGRKDCVGNGDETKPLPFCFKESEVRCNKTCLPKNRAFNCTFNKSLGCTGNCAKCIKNKKYIKQSEVCNGYFDCEDKSDECTCQRNKTISVHESCFETYKSLSSKLNFTEKQFQCADGTKNISLDKKLDGTSDCKDFSDECTFVNDDYSSSKEMIRDVVLKLYFWVVSVIIMFGNSCIFYFTLKKLDRSRAKSSVLYFNRILIGNLALSDSLMGIVLFTLLIKSHLLSGEYCEHEFEWRTSHTCNFIGVLSSVSSQTSINLVVLMTVLRLRTTLSPFRSQVIHKKTFAFLVFFCWLFAVVCAVMPLQSVVEYVHIEPNPFFISNRVNRTVVDEFIKDTLLIMNRSSLSALQRPEWWKLPGEITTSFPERNIKIRRYFGYFNLHSVCFPDFFKPTTEQGFIRIFVACFNGLVLIFVAVTYLIIYNVATKNHSGDSSSPVNKTKIKENDRMKLRMTLVVVFDVLMLIPIIIMSIINGVSPNLLQPHVCAVASIILLPISSFANPLLYGRVHRKVLEKVRQLLVERKKVAAHHDNEVTDSSVNHTKVTVM